AIATLSSKLSKAGPGGHIVILRRPEKGENVQMAEWELMEREDPNASERTIRSEYEKGDLTVQKKDLDNQSKILTAFYRAARHPKRAPVLGITVRGANGPVLMEDNLAEFFARADFKQ